MAAYNHVSGLSMAAPSAVDALGLGQDMNHQNLPDGLNLSGYEPDLNFEEALLDTVSTMPVLPFTPSYDFETFSATFEDPFPYSAGPAGRPYELAPHDGDAFNESASPHDEGLDNKLLGFSSPIIKAALIDDNSQFSEASMTAELFGMFFLAEDVYAAENTGRPLELTCYRRNLWWCSAQITLPRQITHVVTGNGRHAAVLELAASITAMESIEGKATEIICIPWKSTAANSANNGSSQHEETKAAGSPPNLLIDLANGQELDNGLVSVPVSWKRLQFKHATANNGRRKGQQQHYVVQVNLLARVKPNTNGTGGPSGSSPSKESEEEWLKIAEIQSGPVIVRGRSPRNFVSRRDVPLTGNAGTGGDKKQQQLQQPQQQLQHHQLHQQQQVDRHGSIDSAAHQQQLHRSNSLSSDMQTFQRFHNKASTQQPSDWSHAYPQQSPQHQAKKMTLSPNIPRPPVPSWDTHSRMPSKMTAQPAHHPIPTPQRSNSTAIPINLSLSEDERSPNRVSADRSTNSPPLANTGTVASSSTNSKSVATSNKKLVDSNTNSTAVVSNENPFDNDELLYEYFPLSLDDWMLPVDAIYRPHVVHHTIVPPEIKAQQVRNKSKRYFSAE